MADTCPTCGRKRTRSSEQNRRYFALINEISDKLRPQEIQHSPEVWHVYFRQRFLGSKDVILPNGKTLLIPTSTSGLPVDEFNAYMMEVEVWAAEHGVYLPE
jgi:hypothetical protein